VPAPLLVASGVRKTYRSGATPVEALRGVDLVIEQGDLLMVMGRSGNGKTTLLNCLSGLDEIDAGEVRIDGRDIHALADAERSDHRVTQMGFVFQSFNLLPVLSAVENVELPLLIARRADHRAARARALELLDRVDLGGRAHSRPGELSGGEQQRVAVARALVGEPAIVWADEPTGNLDTETAESVLDLLGDVHAGGQTLVVVTHDEAIGQSGTRLVQVEDGRVAYDGAPDDELVAEAPAPVDR